MEPEEKPTKNWFQQALERLKKPKHGESPAMTVPPELVEKIFKMITEPNTLLHCRLVCAQWKQVADDMLEKQRLSTWTAFDTELNLRASTLSPPVWAVPQCSSDSALYLILPSALKSKIRGSPFPHKSLAIIGFDHSHFDDDRSCPRLKFKAKLSFGGFFQNVGHYLTSLVLHDLTLGQGELWNLSTVPFLKALTLSKVQLCINSKSPPTSPSYQTTHLELINCDYAVVKSVLFLYSHQLISLKIVGLDGEIAVERETFANLKQLFVYDVHGKNIISMMENTETPPPLEYYSAIKSRQRSYSRENMEEVLLFVSKLATSVVYLRLNLKISALPKLLENSGGIFRKLQSLEIACCGKPNCEADALKEIISPWCPKLETVKFISGNGTGWYEDRECLVCAEFVSDKGPSIGHVAVGGKKFFSMYLPFNRT